jgi:hypothetical protein
VKRIRIPGNNSLGTTLDLLGRALNPNTPYHINPRLAIKDDLMSKIDSLSEARLDRAVAKRERIKKRNLKNGVNEGMRFHSNVKEVFKQIVNEPRD